MNGAGDTAADAAVQTTELESEGANASGRKYGPIFAKVARGAVLLMLAVMIVSWAITISDSKGEEPPPVSGRMYS